MTYPGTKIREHTALESGLIQRVEELEKERDELVLYVRAYAGIILEIHNTRLLPEGQLDSIHRLLEKYK